MIARLALRLGALGACALVSGALQGCVGAVAGAAVDATGAVAAGTVRATGKVAGATVGAGRDVVRGGHKKKHGDNDPRD